MNNITSKIQMYGGIGSRVILGAKDVLSEGDIGIVDGYLTDEYKEGERGQGVMRKVWPAYGFFGESKVKFKKGIWMPLKVDFYVP